MCAPEGQKPRMRQASDIAAVAADVALLLSELEEAQILSLDLERDMHSTVQAALRSEQEREAAVAALAELRHEAQMNTQASQMALEEALVDRSMQMDDLHHLTEEIKDLKILLLQGESDMAKSSAEMAAQQHRAAAAAAEALDTQTTLDQALQCAESLAIEAQRLRDAARAAQERADKQEEARLAVEGDLLKARDELANELMRTGAAHKELLEEQQRSQEVNERLAASERTTEREREAARRLGRDKDELLLQLQEAAERCKELETSTTHLKRAQEEREAVIAQEEAIVTTSTAQCREQLVQVQARFEEITLHKSKLEGHTHKLQAHIAELKSQVRGAQGQ